MAVVMWFMFFLGVMVCILITPAINEFFRKDDDSK